MIGIQVLQDAIANKQVEVIYKTLIEWNIQISVKGLLFDKTVVNSCRQDGTCVLFESILGKNVFYLSYFFMKN